MAEQEVLWALRKRDSKKIYKGLPLATIKAWILEARIEPDDYVTNTEIKKWAPASSIDELVAYFSPDTLGSGVMSGRDTKLPWESRSSSEDEMTIDMTPMIDVTFILLIFFMVTATFSIHEVKNIQIPKAKHTTKGKQEKISVSVDAAGQIYVGKSKIELKDLGSYLKQEVSKTLQQDIVLTADHTLDYGFIITVLDGINGAGVKNVKLKLEKRDR